MEKLTIEKFKEKINNNDYSFSNFDIGLEIQNSLYLLDNKIVDFSSSNISNIKFQNISLKNSKFINSKFINVKFESVNLVNSNFEKSTFEKTFFIKSDLYKSIFSGTNFTEKNNTWQAISMFKKFFKACQLNGSYFFDSNIISDVDIKNLEKLKIIYNNLSEQKYILQEISDSNIGKLTGSFEELEKNFKKEEKNWLFVSFLAFFLVLLFFFIPILSIFFYEKIYHFIGYGILIFFIIIFIFFIDKFIKKFRVYELIQKQKAKTNYIIFLLILIIILILFFDLKIIIFSILLNFFEKINSFFNTLNIPEKSYNSYYYFIPFGVVLVSFLYFSLNQYLKFKKLRIENQNKVALLHGMIGIKADTDKDMDKNIFYQNVANIVFSKVYEGKEENLPLDKVLELVKIINSNNKK